MQKDIDGIFKTNPSSAGGSRSVCLLAGCLLLVLLSGCEQRRYQPSKWRPSVAKSTLPTPNATEQTLTSSTLPSRSGTTLAQRGNGSLPLRITTTLTISPNSLPQRSWSDGPKLIWDTRPKEDMVRPQSAYQPDWRPATGGSLPVRGSLPNRFTGSSLPSRIPGRLTPRTMPLRNPGLMPDHLLPLPNRGRTTLPNRWPQRGSGTLPQRNPLR